MPETALITNELTDEPEEYDSPEDLVDSVAPAYSDWERSNVPGFPREYVVYYWGSRGASKTLQLARMSIMALAQGIPVFTNLELYPEKAGIKAKPNPVNLEFLLSFDESMANAVITISEIDTWFDRMRQTATGNRLGGKFLQQMRKKGLRIGFDTQDYLPGNLMQQVDKLVVGHDFVHTDWGRERELPEGTTFYYDCWDYSGRFTGHRGRYWREALYHAEKVWRLFNTYRIHDPLEFARKVKIKGGEMEYDQDTGQLTLAAEKAQKQWENNRRANASLLKRLMESYRATGFIDLVSSYGGIQEDDDRYLFYRAKVAQALTSLPEDERATMQNVYEELRELASQREYARWRDNGRVIEFAKPAMLADKNENSEVTT